MQRVLKLRLILVLTSPLEIYLRILNRFRDFISPRKIGMRIDTYPYLSVDAYVIKLGLVEGVEDATETGSGESKVTKSVFVSSQELKSFRQRVEDGIVAPRQIVVAGGDETYSPEMLENMFPNVDRIMATNLIVESAKVRALPLGLESPSYRSGGNLRDFHRTPVCSAKFRPISLLVAWNCQTNPTSRNEALRTLSPIADTLAITKRITAKKLHYLMRRSLFVPAPAGNGIDTHRIWEAIYLGAIPIVVEHEFFPALNGWPIWVISSWKELTEYRRHDLEEFYDQFTVSRQEILERSKIIFQEVVNA